MNISEQHKILRTALIRHSQSNIRPLKYSQYLFVFLNNTPRNFVVINFREGWEC
ncbi:MAG: hypothetical protein ACOVQ4_23060 [Flectobacillus sp.]|uniref:hypothetical protein n=1 Tax=Flectobacillus sp. TaxID=50419 RepID=UPI003B9DAFA0